MSRSQDARSPGVIIQYEVPRTRPDWTLPEEPVPESQPHDQTIDLLKAILLAWLARTGSPAQVARNLAVRWEPSQPNIGVDPDLCLVDPRTPEGDELESLCTWKPGHSAPRLAIEVVSSKPRKDYEIVPEKCAAAGIEELWVFDPKLVGPLRRGGPHRLQLWRRQDERFLRIYAGEGPVFSPVLSAWVFAVNEGQRVRIADDREGTAWWMTREEAERSAKNAAVAAQEAERAAKEAALARVRELEEQLRQRGG